MVQKKGELSFRFYFLILSLSLSLFFLLKMSVNDEVLFDIDQLEESPRTSNERESVSSASYKALPTSLSLENYRQSESTTESIVEDIDEIELDYEPQPKPKFPAMELVIRNLGILQERAAVQSIQKNNQPATVNAGIDFSMETEIDMKLFNSNLKSPSLKSAKDIPANYLNPREQEEAGMHLLRFISFILFDLLST